MEVKMIRSADELEMTTPFYVDKLLWGTKHIPKTYAYIGFVPDDAFYVKMVCEESDPLRNYTKRKDPVYRDSAMEVFLLFNSERARAYPPVYLNFEANANGALIASYGKERSYRSYFSMAEYKEFDCRAEIKEDRWSFVLHIPVTVLERIYGPLNLGEGSIFECNFYKISETKEIEHYASYSPIQSEAPSFHMPEFFAEAVITA